MQSTPLIVTRSDRQDNIAPVNLSPIFSAETSSVTTQSTCSGLSDLSTLYGEKIGNFTAKTEINEFSHWLCPKITTIAVDKNQLNGTYIEKRFEQSNTTADPFNKENKESDIADNRFSYLDDKFVLSDISNIEQGLSAKSSDKISITVNKQSSVWLNASRDYAKEPINDPDDKDMEELHTELDKILDQLQKLVT